jgi:hypothetical protein
LAIFESHDDLAPEPCLRVSSGTPPSGLGPASDEARGPAEGTNLTETARSGNAGSCSEQQELLAADPVGIAAHHGVEQLLVG